MCILVKRERCISGSSSFREASARLKTEGNHAESVTCESWKRRQLPAFGFQLQGLKLETSLQLRLRAWRDALGLTQAQLADRLGVHIGVLKKYEQGVNIPGGEALAALARTGVNVNWLLTGEGSMRPAAPEPAPKAQETASERHSYGTDPHPQARRWAAIVQLVDDIEDPTRREALLAELYTRAQDAAELAALKRTVQKLTGSG
jgi:transcriptional regulator with XRE-family HTH domain